jgi:hypothetical protein
MMTVRRRRVLLVVAVVAFCAWISWLAYLAATVSRPIVLARPQFLASQVDVIADLTADEEGRPKSAATVVKVEWPARSDLAPEMKIEVSNLPLATAADGWTGAGEYILPLVKEADGVYRVAPIPRSPGYAGRERPLIYRATSQTIDQLRQIRGQD